MDRLGLMDEPFARIAPHRPAAAPPGVKGGAKPDHRSRARRAHDPHPAPGRPAAGSRASDPCLIGGATPSRGCSVAGRTSAGSPRATTAWQSTTSPRPSAIGYASGRYWTGQLDHGASRAELGMKLSQSAEAQNVSLGQIEQGWHLA
jgi:hypothetical protein